MRSAGPLLLTRARHRVDAQVLCGECASAGVKKIAKQLGSGSCMALARCQASITQSLNSSGALSYVHRLTQICDVNVRAARAPRSRPPRGAARGGTRPGCAPPRGRVQKLANEISSDIDCTGPGKPSPSTVAMLLRGRS